MFKISNPYEILAKCVNLVAYNWHDGANFACHIFLEHKAILHVVKANIRMLTRYYYHLVLSRHLLRGSFKAFTFLVKLLFYLVFFPSKYINPNTFTLFKQQN